MELKIVRLTKKFGGERAINDLNITLSNGVYGLHIIPWDGDYFSIFQHIF